VVLKLGSLVLRWVADMKGVELELQKRVGNV
jgi:hypothetical protein